MPIFKGCEEKEANECKRRPEFWIKYLPKWGFGSVFDFATAFWAEVHFIRPTLVAILANLFCHNKRDIFEMLCKEGGIVRLATWNCNGALRRKLEQADALGADVLVIQECEDPAQSTTAYRDWAGDHAWIGYGKNKGIGIFPRKGQKIERLDWAQEQGGLFLPVRIDGNLTLLGVWTLGRKTSGQYSYIAQFWHYLYLNRHRFAHDTLICGDFNSNQIWDATRKKRNHSDCVRELGAAGFRSLYHLATGEGQGAEAQPTFYLHRSDLKPYHIDYVFAHDAMLGSVMPVVQVGHRADWIGASDHMPLVVDLPHPPDLNTP